MKLSCSQYEQIRQGSLDPSLNISGHIHPKCKMNPLNDHSRRITKYHYEQSPCTSPLQEACKQAAPDIATTNSDI
jgi:hypothetical protein